MQMSVCGKVVSQHIIARLKLPSSLFPIFLCCFVIERHKCIYYVFFTQICHKGALTQNRVQYILQHLWSKYIDFEQGHFCLYFKRMSLFIKLWYIMKKILIKQANAWGKSSIQLLKLLKNILLIYLTTFEIMQQQKHYQ